MKLFGCPVDSDILRDINPAQMLWYAFMLNQQREEQFDAELNMTEYLASFINYEAVRQTKLARETRKVVPDEDFEKTIRGMSGRDFSEDMLKTATRAETIEDSGPIKEMKKKGQISAEDIRKYAGIELDDITFTPKKQ